MTDEYDPNDNRRLKDGGPLVKASEPTYTYGDPVLMAMRVGRPSKHPMARSLRSTKSRFSRGHDGRAEMFVYVVEGNDYNPTNLKRLLFDCHGHYQDLGGSGFAMLNAPPQSIAGQLSRIACAGPLVPTKPVPSPPRSQTSDAITPSLSDRLQSEMNDLKPLRSEDGVNDADWLRIEGPEGEVSAIIDAHTIQHDTDGNAHARTCVIKDGACHRGFRQTWFYNCHDHTYSWIDTSILPGRPRKMYNAEPSSVAEKLLVVACR